MTDDEASLLNIRIQLEALVTEREGMIALNREREHLGLSLAYGEDAFMALAQRMDRLRTQL